MHYIYRAFWPNISCIVHGLAVLGIAREIQVLGFLQVIDLFTIAS